MKEINGNELFNMIEGHSNYHGEDILVAISVMQEGRTPKDIKPIDAKFIKHGHWNEKSDCSVCGNAAPTDNRYDFIDIAELKYCPYCGAIMDEVIE